MRFSEEKWEQISKPSISDSTKRQYEAGGAANLYQGEPLTIVYGTGNSPRGDLLRKTAEKLASCGGPVYARMGKRFPIVADSEVTEELAARNNLILVGTPADNIITRKLLPQLPLLIENGSLKVANRPVLPLDGQVLSFLYPHPKHPDRYIYMLAPFCDEKGLVAVSEKPQYFLTSPSGFDRISAADLLAQNLSHQVAREMQFDKNWEWIEMAGSNNPIGSEFSDRNALAKVYLKVMREKSGADYAFWWGPKDRGMWGFDFNFLKSYNPKFYTEADFRTQHRAVETMVARMTGRELKAIRSRWGETSELTFDPEPTGVISDEEKFRIHIPMDLYIKIGRRKENLSAPEEGPVITADFVREEVFRRN